MLNMARNQRQSYPSKAISELQKPKRDMSGGILGKKRHGNVKELKVLELG